MGQSKKDNKTVEITPDTLVCSNCGKDNVQLKAWVDANTQELIDTVSSDAEDCWCEDCEEHYELVTKAEFDEQ